ncbi:MAG TPA: GNAT family N-acetyltransferase [Candidatus Aenigmarchaeota archaeon]|nr:GNAT family N-acetyltransferase [Candidatus Aenigmarchaeota archaeon]
MNVRCAKRTDARGIALVLFKSYNISCLKEGEDAFKNEIKRGYRYVVMEKDNKIIGAASWIMHGLPKHGLAELDRIALLPEFRGKGHAMKLFKFLLADIKQFYKNNDSRLRKLYLLTHEDNVRAQNFYKKLGFKKEAVLRDHFYKGKNEYVFSMFF